MALDALIELLPQLGVGGAIAALVLVLERLKRVERVYEEVVKRLEERMQRIEWRLERVDSELDTVRRDVEKTGRLVAFICAQVNGGRECLND